ncbi:MAG: Rpn family recombination-promoting nuclease/putative transposase [Planctomycetia bacterium]|nr:Rpn family recombination-promoting nuclease/putative transposase [Planctomycetia bacterium]
MGKSEFMVLPTQDVFIHYLFTSPDSEEILLSFVNAVLADAGRPVVEKINIANTFNPQRFTDDKWFINDIKAVDKEGNVYEIEIQMLNQESFENRILYYWSREYSSQLVKGEDYRQLNPVIGIAVTRFLLFPDLEKMHNEFYITCRQNPNYILTDDLQLHFIELTDEKWNGMANMLPVLREWLDFLATANQKTEEEMEVLLKKKKSNAVQDAYKKYRSFCQTPELRSLAEERWLADVYKRTLLGEAEDRGVRKGLEKGREEGRLEERLEILLVILQARFGEIPKEVLEKIKSSESNLRELVAWSTTCNTLEEFCRYWK